MTRSLRELLEAGHDRVVTSDRFTTCGVLPLERRQVCWAHTIRTHSLASLRRQRLVRPRSLGGAVRRRRGEGFRLKPA
jgi:hypothetical protein